ncbi:unnamed protein product, partial [Polarella glacialis]
DLEEDEVWIAELFEPLRRMFFIPPPPKKPPQWFMRDEGISPDTTVVVLMGVHPDAKSRIWKEVHVFKTRRMVHIYAVSAYGHQQYRQLEFTTNARLCLHELQPDTDDRDSPWPAWGRHAAGSSGCDLGGHPASVTVSRTAVRGALGFGAEVDPKEDPLDDPEEQPPSGTRTISVPVVQDWPLVGDEVQGLYKTNRWYPARIANITAEGMYVLNWNDRDPSDQVKTLDQLRRKDGTDPKLQREARDSGADRAAQETEEIIIEDGVERRRQQLRTTPAEAVAVHCPEGHEVQPEKKKNNSCNYCGTKSTAFRCRDCDFDFCENCYKNLSKRVSARMQPGDRVVLKGNGYHRK